MKSLDDVKMEMGMLFDEVRKGEVELKVASELANIAGKYLKAEQLQLAREIFIQDKAKMPLKLAAAG
jgi:hypothetical protein